MGSRDMTTKQPTAVATTAKGSVRIYYNGVPTKTIERPGLISLDQQPIDANPRTTKSKVLTNKSIAGSTSTSTSNHTSRSGQNSMPRSRSVCPTEQTAWTSISNPKLETLFEQNNNNANTTDSNNKADASGSGLKSSLNKNGKTLSEGNLVSTDDMTGRNTRGRQCCGAKDADTEISFMSNKRSVSNSELSKIGRKARTKFTRNNSEIKRANGTGASRVGAVDSTARHGSITGSRVTNNTSTVAVNAGSQAGRVARLERQDTSVSVLRKKPSQNSISTSLQQQKKPAGPASRTNRRPIVRSGSNAAILKRELNNNEIPVPKQPVDKNGHGVDDDDVECEADDYDVCIDSDDEREERIIQWLLGIEEGGFEIVAPEILPEDFDEPVPRQTDTAIHIVYDGD
ncbi:uncharacterized protein LOC141909792 [Tubulanus polymorphus]|uniref:uncharacterized protein LOC141909792 n=1 Tax=Tubulanus polymorphus TaxID=672921 RepID=UPI003DA69552